MSEETSSEYIPPSGQLQKIVNWEKMPFSTLLVVIVAHFECDNVEFTVNRRPEVASRMWYTLSFELPERYGHISRRRRMVAASRLDLMSDRLISLLDREQLSKTRLEWKQYLLNQQANDNNN